MNFQILNETGSAVTIQNVTYQNGEYVPVEKLIGFGGVKCSRNDVDGPNAGRNMQGDMIRDRVAIKHRWDVTLTGAIRSINAQALFNLTLPVSFYIKTDFPTGSMSVYHVYSNNNPVQFCIKRPDGTEYYSGATLNFIEI